MAPLHFVVANLVSSARVLRLCMEDLLGSDDGRKGVVTTDTNTHQHTPKDEQTDNGHGVRVGRKSLGKSCEDDHDELKTVHLLAADQICENTEANLTDDGAGASRDLDCRVGGFGDAALAGAMAALPVDYTQHGGDQVDGEEIVGIGEETNTGDDNCADMVPAKWSLVDFGQGKTSALVGVGNVCYKS